MGGGYRRMNRDEESQALAAPAAHGGLEVPVNLFDSPSNVRMKMGTGKLH